MALFSKEIERNQLKLGDHIYSWRTAYLYAHHGIYVGEGKVIHFTRSARGGIGSGAPLDNIVVSSAPANPTYNPCPRCGYQSIDRGVLSSCIDCFLAGGNLYIFEYGVSLASFVAKGRGGTCTLAVSDPPEDVLHRAFYLLQNGFGVYHVFKNNCVDFAIYCKTGLVVSTSISMDRSVRVVTVAAAGSVIFSLATSISGMTGLGYGWYCVNRVFFDIGVRRDVIKISAEALVARAGSLST